MIYIDENTTVLNLPRTFGQNRDIQPQQYYTKAEIDEMCAAIDRALGE